MSINDPHPHSRPPQPREGWRARLLRASPLARDMTIIVLVKAGALALLWWAFFAAPFARQLSLDPKAVDHQWLSVPPAGDATRPAR